MIKILQYLLKINNLNQISGHIQRKVGECR